MELIKVQIKQEHEVKVEPNILISPAVTIKPELELKPEETNKNNLLNKKNPEPAEQSSVNETDNVKKPDTTKKEVERQTIKRKLTEDGQCGGEENGEKNHVNIPYKVLSSSSSSTSSSTSSISSKRQRKSRAETSNNVTDSNAEVTSKKPEAHASTPLTPPPSVSQEATVDPESKSIPNAKASIDAFGNHLNPIGHYKNVESTKETPLKALEIAKNTEANTETRFKQPSTSLPSLINLATNKLETTQKNSSTLLPQTPLPINQIPPPNIATGQQTGTSEKITKNNSIVIDEVIDEDSSDDEQPFKDSDDPLKELLLNQLQLGSELLKGKTQSFNGFLIFLFIFQF